MFFEIEEDNDCEYCEIYQLCPLTQENTDEECPKKLMEEYSID